MYNNLYVSMFITTLCCIHHPFASILFDNVWSAAQLEKKTVVHIILSKISYHGA